MCCTPNAPACSQAHPLYGLTAEDVDEAQDVNFQNSVLSVRACLPATERSGHARPADQMSMASGADPVARVPA